MRVLIALNVWRIWLFVIMPLPVHLVCINTSRTVRLGTVEHQLSTRQQQPATTPTSLHLLRLLYTFVPSSIKLSSSKCRLPLLPVRVTFVVKGPSLQLQPASPFLFARSASRNLFLRDIGGYNSRSPR
jgi:hypothetical protein